VKEIPLPGARLGRAARWRMLSSLAWRESRSARRRLLLYMSSISLGVAALVAIDSFAANVTGSVQDQSRSLLGGDLAVRTRSGFPERATEVLDSMRTTGVDVAEITTFASMAIVAGGDRTRLVQVRAVSELYPLYGEVVTQPAGSWSALRLGQGAIVDPALLIALDAEIGDTLQLGMGSFEIAGIIRNVPGDAGISAAVGPRVFIPKRFLASTELLGLGSRMEEEALLRVAPGTDTRRLAGQLRERMDSVRVRTAADSEVDLTEAIDTMGRFLGIVGLIALLLGGIGVASGVHAFVARKIDTVAVLRCLGATSAQVMVIYVAQSAAMGLVGAAMGVLLGMGIQLALPLALAEFIPVDVSIRPVLPAILSGLAVGVWVALVFALLPLLGLRRVPPLQALRRDAETGTGPGILQDIPRLVVAVALVVSVAAIAIVRTGSMLDGLALSAAAVGVIIVLWGSAALLADLARRSLRARRWPYVVRQGIANLYRPANQTRAVVLALGFGVCLISTLYLVQSNLLRQFDVGTEGSRGNLLLFDVQEDQLRGVDSLVLAGGHELIQHTPIVTMRIAEINRVNVAEVEGNAGGRQRWPYRREYRSTYRDSITPLSERITEGRWFDGDETGLPEVSFEQDIAGELGLSLGDTVTWNVQGVLIPTIVTSFREVDWARFEPNFFVVFETRALRTAPQQYVVIADVADPAALGTIQRDVVRAWPNVSSVDLTLVRETVQGIVGKVSVAIRFLALFSLGMGIPVLFSAVASTRRQRVREGVLLKTLGATRRQIRHILLAEYLLLGTLGSLAGLVLAIAGAWGLMRFVFEGTFSLLAGPGVLIAVGMIALTAAIGMLAGREVFAETPMAALRES
jgi:putative ABC transport system permease protein